MRFFSMVALVTLSISCGSDDDSGTDGSSSGSSLSANFTSLGCAGSSCHGSDGKGATGSGDTNITQSDLDLAAWTLVVRTNAESPMPTYSADQYSDADLKSDYQFLTGRTE